MMELGGVASSIPDLDYRLLLIPLITGMIGYTTNWVAIRLLFKPIDFVGVRVPGLKAIAPKLPRKIQQIPGILQGKFGWQGIIPSRSAKMGSIAAEKGVAKIADEREFYQTFDPERIAAHMVTESRDEVRKQIDEILREEYPDIWTNAPKGVRQLVHARIQDQLPRIADNITEQIGDNVEELLDVNMMITTHMENHPKLINRMFLEVGDRELNFVINSGFYIGTFLGMFSIPLSSTSTAGGCSPSVASRSDT